MQKCFFHSENALTQQGENQYTSPSELKLILQVSIFSEDLHLIKHVNTFCVKCLSYHMTIQETYFQIYFCWYLTSSELHSMHYRLYI